MMEVNDDDKVKDVEESIDRHKEEILEKFQEACSLIELCGIIDNPNRPSFQWGDKENKSEQ